VQLLQHIGKTRKLYKLQELVSEYGPRFDAVHASAALVRLPKVVFAGDRGAGDLTEEKRKKVSGLLEKLAEQMVALRERVFARQVANSLWACGKLAAVSPGGSAEGAGCPGLAGASCAPGTPAPAARPVGGPALAGGAALLAWPATLHGPRALTPRPAARPRRSCLKGRPAAGPGDAARAQEQRAEPHPHSGACRGGAGGGLMLPRAAALLGRHRADPWPTRRRRPHPPFLPAFLGVLHQPPPAWRCPCSMRTPLAGWLAGCAPAESCCADR
jgi:hypothetical protein